MRAASGLYEGHLERSGFQVTAVCALSVILVTRVGMIAGFAMARLFGGKCAASLCAAFGCVLCAWSLLYGAGSKGLYECFCWPLCPPKSDLTLTDPAFGDAEAISQSCQRAYRFNGWITPE
ncbi:MAG: hypothetical protein L6R28_00335 [Planctomycetes bacterium]|nr:hypothetical protein [Planctomycetota bacterium]